MPSRGLLGIFALSLAMPWFCFFRCLLKTRAHISNHRSNIIAHRDLHELRETFRSFVDVSDVGVVCIAFDDLPYYARNHVLPVS